MDTDPITPMDRPGIDVADTQAPRCIVEVTLGWLEGVLRKAGRNVALASFSVERLSGGLMGNTYRIKLVHSEGSETMLPSVIFKCTGDSPSSRLLGKKGFGIEGRPGFYGAEVRFYDQFRDSVSIRAPQSFSTWLSPDEDQFSLLLEDYPNGRPGDEFEGCTQLQATDCMVSLAGLHAPFWNDKVLQTTDWMRPLSENLMPRLQGNMDRALARLRERYLHLLSSEEISIIEEFTPHYGRWCCGSGKNLTLVHSDFRLDNMLFDRDGTGVTLDWQTFSSGHPGRDTGLFIGCSLATEIRRQSEKAILAAYHQRMTALGVTNYSFEECFDDFRWGVFIGLQNVVIGMNAVQSTERGLKMFRQKLAKCCATIMDHDALQVLH